MVTNVLLSFGITRDSLIWFWSRLTSLALLLASGTVDLSHYLTDPQIHTVMIVCALVLWFSGKYDSSPLPGKKVV